MGQALDRFLNHWQGHNADRPFHAADLPFLERTGLYQYFDHGLCPYPYVGDLRAAKVWILMRNPSIGDNDYQEERRPPLRDLISDNLAREFGDHPFIHLNEAIDPSDAFSWWNYRRGFAELVGQVARLKGITVREARKLISQRVAILELCPYRSKGFPPKVLACPSSILAKEAAREAVEEAMKTGNRGFLVPWNAAFWSLPSNAIGAVVKNQPAQGFTFRMGSKSGFGEHIWHHAFEAQ